MSATSLELITTNLSGSLRREKLHGREFIVAPLTLIVPGVLSGSRGPLYYPPEELAKDPQAWNGMPIVLDHPTRDGQPVSARDPKVLNEFGLGTVFAAQYGDKLLAEGWFDVEQTRKVSPSTLTKLEAGHPEELSTGLFTENQPAQNGANHNGKQYTHIARNLRPDHLAILPGKTGACSIKDGCGLNVNQEQAKSLGEKLLNLIGISTNKADEEDDAGLKVATQTKGGTKRRKKKKRADNQININQIPLEDAMAALKPEERKQLVDNLITGNCSCEGKTVKVPTGFDESDRAALNAMPDQKLLTLEECRKHAAKGMSQNSAATLDPAKVKPVKVGDKLVTANAEGQLVVNDAPKEPPVVNEGQRKPITEADLPAELREDLAFARNAKQQMKQRYITRITANAGDRAQALADSLKDRSLQDLELLSSAIPEAPAKRGTHTADALLPHYLGAAAPATNQGRDDGFAKQDLDMIPPTLNFEELAKERKTA